MATLLSPQAAYELWADTYDASAHNPLMQAEQSVVERVLRSITASRALDVGTGSGRYLSLLEETGAAVVGLDLSMAMLRRSGGPPRICADACALPFRRTVFQVVNASLMVGDVVDLRAWTAEMARVLTPGGHLVYSDFHPTWIAEGWQRTFRDAAGTLRAVRFEPHTIDDHLAALDAAGLLVRAIREPKLTIKRRNLPVLAVFHAVKPDRRFP
jgi:malonyl-CoA O-methyltransferase